MIANIGGRLNLLTDTNNLFGRRRRRRRRRLELLFVALWLTIFMTVVHQCGASSKDISNQNVTMIGSEYATLADYYDEEILSLMPRPNQEYPLPSQEILNDFERIVKNMMALDGRYNDILRQKCSSIFLGSLRGKYQIGIFEDSKFHHSYCLFVTTSSEYPWGTVVVYPPTDGRDSSNLSIGCPHPLHDRNTGTQSIAVFQGTNARSLVISGAYRYASHISSCQGESFRISDAAHSIQHGFHTANLAIWKHVRKQYSSSSDHTSIQFHGMGSLTCPGVDAYLTHGMMSLPSTASQPKLVSLWKHITNNFSKIQNETFVLLPTASVPSESVTTKSSSSLSLSLSCTMSGSTNLQGRLWNGVTPEQVCTVPATSISGQFVHLEQKAWMRHPQYSDTWVKAIRHAYREFSTIHPMTMIDDTEITYHRKRNNYDEDT